MKLSDDLQISLSVAVTEAGRRGHEYAGLEHLLYALLMDDITAEVLQQIGVDLDLLELQLEDFLEQEVPVLPEDQRTEPVPTLGFRRVVARAVAHGEGAGQEEIETYDLLVALFEEQDSFARHFLEQQGISRLDLVSYISHGLPGAGDVPQPAPAGEAEAAGAPADSPLEAYTQNLTTLAEAGRIDPIIGRERELERTVHILQRRRKNNPVFVGEPGVGKTALVEGLALRVADETVPEVLRGTQIYRLDLGALLAGTRYRGDFEQRLKGVLAALEDRDDAVLFIDEIHTLIGAGAAGGGTMDASNLLKPGLQSGRLRCIGATTWKEYRQHFERDRALARRFQKVEVVEPTVDETVEILEGLRARYEDHHQVSFASTALRAAADLAARHLRDQRLPDKAIDLMDEAGAAVALADRKQVRVPDVERVLSTMAGIPPRRVKGDERERLRGLEDALRGEIFGQDEAITQLVDAVKVARAGLRDPRKPVGAFLLTGPTGVGKTEVAIQLADALGVELLRYDMSEYMERHSVSRLVGAPPGYVGFDRGGLLTEAVSQSPHAVLLLDEIEKAHHDVFNILLQIMDHGTLTDTNGKVADFRSVVLLMTSNVGARELARGGIGFGENEVGGADEAAYERLFSPEFRNRLDARIAFAPLDRAVMLRIVDKQIDELRVQLAEKRVTLELTDAARARLAERGHSPTFGARPLSRVIDETIKRPLTDELLFGVLEGGGTVVVDAEGEDAGEGEREIVLRYPDGEAVRETEVTADGPDEGARNEADEPAEAELTAAADETTVADVPTEGDAPADDDADDDARHGDAADA